jgi:hypothetical protein
MVRSFYALFRVVLESLPPVRWRRGVRSEIQRVLYATEDLALLHGAAAPADSRARDTQCVHQEIGCRPALSTPASTRGGAESVALDHWELAAD